MGFDYQLATLGGHFAEQAAKLRLSTWVEMNLRLLNQKLSCATRLQNLYQKGQDLADAITDIGKIAQDASSSLIDDSNLQLEWIT